MKIFNTRDDLFKSFDKGLKIAEIGVFKGEFSRVILENSSPSELYLVDIFSGRMGSGDRDGNNMVYVNLDNEYKRLISEYSKVEEVKIIKSTSIDFLKKSEDNYFDIIYIDALHEYEPVKADIEYAFIKIKKGGFLCGHDYVYKSPGVIKAVDDFCRNNNLEINYITKDGCPSYAIQIL